MDLIAASEVAVRTTGTTPISTIEERMLFWLIDLILPIHYAAVVGIVGLLVFPVMTDLVRHRVLVEFNAESGTSREREIAIADRKGLFNVALAEADLLLAEKVRNGG